LVNSQFTDDGVVISDGARLVQTLHGIYQLSQCHCQMPRTAEFLLPA